ncbi:hypothetical protein [Adlercreutzia sp. ZJ138]|uniref:hypothetical protein n=1 Tax=Adlercreutzia sp. ZJ138 TaxID=2709405 RepID=UPI0013EB2500|nr:hypothetical protein [Adlercreutzia sp. ZJ138]
MSYHHEHEHNHHHHDAVEASTTSEEKIALLRYMLAHNTHHAEELATLSMNASEKAEAVFSRALVHFNESNALLAEYIQMIEAD